VCGLLLFAIWLIYGQTLDHALLDYDDGLFVFTNPLVTAGLTGEGTRWAFTDGPAGEWYPLDPLSHMLDCQLFGLNPLGTSPHQRAASRRRVDRFVPRAVAHDRRALAQCFRRHGLCRSSPAR
jgi:hypothetical protein